MVRPPAIWNELDVLEPRKLAKFSMSGRVGSRSTCCAPRDLHVQRELPPHPDLRGAQEGADGNLLRLYRARRRAKPEDRPQQRADETPATTQAAMRPRPTGADPAARADGPASPTGPPCKVHFTKCHVYYTN